jgi:uncharacterized membrane protein YkvA (DUF1232 family)
MTTRRKAAIMPEKGRLRDPGRTAGLLAEILKQGRLILRLLADRRVPVWPKLIIPATIAYVLSPIDLLSDPIVGLGQLDDIAVFLIGLKLFIELCPSHIVREHLENLSTVIDGSYRVVEDEKEQQETPPAQISAADQEPSGVEFPADDIEQE